MRSFFILCMALSIVQAINAAGGVVDPNTNSAENQLVGGAQRVVQRTTTTTRALSSQTATKPGAQAAAAPAPATPAASAAAPAPATPAASAAAPAPTTPAAAAAPATGVDLPTDSSAESPQTISESGKRLAKTARKVVDQQGAGVLNGITGLLKAASGSINFFGILLLSQANNARDLAKKSLETMSGLGDNTAKGAGNLIDSARTIGGEGTKSLRDMLDKGTALGVGVTRLGGAVIGTPISIATDVVSTGSRLAKIPSRLSRAVTSNYIKPLLNFAGVNSDEN